MKEVIDKAIEKHGRIIVAKYIDLNTEIEHKSTITRTKGGMYILEDLTRNKNEGVYEEEHINTWDFEEVKKWGLAAIITRKIYENA